MGLRDRVVALLKRLAGRRPSAEDERLVALFRNRAELKKELASIDDQRHRLLDRLKLQEGATMRVEEHLATLEAWLGRPEEVAAVVVMLAGDESAFTTGTTHLIDGGWTL